MAKIIIGNVDNEHMAGDPAFKFNTKLRQTSSVVANRMIWLVEEGDIVVLPSPPSDAFIQYVQRNTGVDFRPSSSSMPNRMRSIRPFLLSRCFSALALSNHWRRSAWAVATSLCTPTSMTEAWLGSKPI